jgi:alkanesulfonate monooxygenase SsuD/methylene tetrahydromethanopterin reductase-like flavin-dependent oxidoreductase (luciferase family)
VPSTRRPTELSVEVGGAIIGTPDAAIEQIEALISGSGGSEGFLIAMLGVVNRDRMMHSFYNPQRVTRNAQLS